MSNYNSLKATIDANIKQNGNQEITGQILNSVLNQMVNILGTGYQFAGIATLEPATDPGTPDAKVFYIANGKGTYEKFGGINVTEDDVVVLYWDSSWHKVATGIASQAKLSELDQHIGNLTPVNKEITSTDDDYVVGFLNSNGTATASLTAFRVSKFIEIDRQNLVSLSIIAFMKIPSGGGICFYNNNGSSYSFLEAIYNEGSTSSDNEPFDIPLSRIPTNATHFRTCYKSDSATKGNFTIVVKDLTTGLQTENKDNLVDAINEIIANCYRRRINISVSDSEQSILDKLKDAFNIGNVDVIFENGIYNFDSIFLLQAQSLGFSQTSSVHRYIELPVGNGCRYYFNGSTINASANSVSDYERATVNLFSCVSAPQGISFEMHDGILKATGLVYIIHDETGGKDGYYSHLYNNMHFIYASGSQTGNLRKPIGGGTGKRGEVIFENCRFTTDYTYDLSFHGCSKSITDDCSFKMKLINCYFSKTIELAYQHGNFSASQDLICIMCGCSLASFAYESRTQIPEGTKDEWAVNKWCCEIRSVVE